MASLGRFFASHRIAVSRAFAGTFLTAMLVTSSAWERSMFGHALFVAGVVLVGVATVGRLSCALNIGGRKNAVLVTEGLYAMTRKPSYSFHPQLFRRSMAEVVWFVCLLGAIYVIEELHELGVMVPVVALP